MNPKSFIEPKEVDINHKRYVISKIPAIQAQTIYRMIMQECKDEGDIGMTYLTETTAISLLTYAASIIGGGESDDWIPLTSAREINVAFDKVEDLITLEAMMIRYNFGFLFDGTLQKLLGVLRDQVQDI